MNSDINKLICILFVHLSAIILENFKDLALIIPEILEFIELHTYKFRLVYNMLDELEWQSLEARREQSSLTFFYKIQPGTVSLDKDKYLTRAPNIRRTRASHESQYNIYLAYIKALKNSLFPGTIPVWNSLLTWWSHQRPLRSLRLLYSVAFAGSPTWIGDRLLDFVGDPSNATIDLGSRGMRFSMPLLCSCQSLLAN